MGASSAKSTSAGSRRDGYRPSISPPWIMPAASDTNTVCTRNDTNTVRRSRPRPMSAWNREKHTQPTMKEPIDVTGSQLSAMLSLTFSSLSVFHSYPCFLYPSPLLYDAVLETSFSFFLFRLLLR